MLPKRLRIDFRSMRPTYEVYTEKRCSRRDLLSAGVCPKAVDGLLLNAYSKKPMRYTLINPEEWFWTDRDWWKDAPFVSVLYDISGGAFSDLDPQAQAAFLKIPFVEMRGMKGRGPLWRMPDGSEVDLVRYLRYRLIAEGYRMTVAYPPTIDLMVLNYCEDKFGTCIHFISSKKPDVQELRKLAIRCVDEVLSDPGKEWDRKSDYYYRFYNGLRKIPIGKDELLATIDLIGHDVVSTLQKHNWRHKLYENLMTAAGFPLAGIKDGELTFFFVTQKSSFKSNVANFFRDYGNPLGLNIKLVQILPENEA